MSMDVGGAKGGVKSDINVTPLVDVMLVLLIIMMIVAPLLQTPVQVTLPAGRTYAGEAGHVRSDRRLHRRPEPALHQCARGDRARARSGG